MDQPTQAKRPNYGEVLEKRAQEIFETMNEELQGALDLHPHFFGLIHDVLKESARESFKAGIEVGTKKAGRPTPRPKRP